MLTKQDLNQIKEIIQDNNKEIRKEIQDSATELRQEFKKDIQGSAENIKTELRNEIDLKLNKHLKPIKRDIKKIKKDQNLIIKFFNEDQLKLQARVEKLENLSIQA